MAAEITVLLPFRDAAPTLPACLESLRRQTFGGWTCLLLDDGSTDGSARVAADCSRADARFRLVRLPRAGLVAALNAGIDRVETPLVARMDADDWMHRSRFELQRGALLRAPELALVGSHVRLFPRASLADGLREYESWLATIRGADDVRRDAFVECPLAHPTWMLRADTLARLRYRDRGWPEDYDLLLRLLRGGGRAGVVPRRLLAWREGPERLSRRDPRYGLDRFTACRAAFLAEDFLRDRDGYLLWGYGQTGRALLRALRAHGKRMRGLIEVHPGRVGQRIHGAPVVAPDGIERLPPWPLIVSVAGAAPRATIRAELAARGLVEGRDFVCAA